MIPLKYYFRKIPNDYETLKALAEGMDVSLTRAYYKSLSTPKPDTYEMQRRIREAISHAQNSWAWLLALISALASVFSALAAWVAIASR